MIELLITGRLTSKRSRADALAHMRDIHGPKVYEPPANAGPMPAFYAQNPALAETAEALGSWACDRDFVTEVGFNDIAHLQAATRTPYYLDTLRPDEENFVDLSSVTTVLTQSLRRQGDDAEESVRLFLFLPRFEASLDAIFAGWVANRTLLSWESAEALPAPAPFAARVDILSFADREAALAFARKHVAGASASWLGEAAGAAVLADHFPVARLKKSRSALSPR